MNISKFNTGLMDLIQKFTNGQADVYLTGSDLSVHWYGVKKSQIDALKVVMADYIDKNYLCKAFDNIRFFY